MSKRWNICAVGILVCGLSCAWAQDEPAQQSSGQTPEGQTQQPVAAYGQDNAPPPIMENPPISGLDLPSLEPHAAPLSYMQVRATVNESADSNVALTAGTNSFNSVSRALGSLELQRLWSNYDLALDYVGGVGYYDVAGQGLKNLQQMDINQKITWKRGEFSVRDGFSYLPEGNFGGAYGSLGSAGSQTLGSSTFGAFWGGQALGGLGTTPRILNVSLGEVEQYLSPKSVVTATGGYSFMHFYGNDVSGPTFIGSSEVTAQGAYDRILSSHTQVGLLYGYQGFDFTVLGTAFHSNVAEAMFGHRITGRMDLMLAAGPQVSFIDTQAAVCSDPTVPLLLCQFDGDTLTTATVRDKRVGVAAQARLRYQFPKVSLGLTYERATTAGSGIFTGAQSDIVRFTASRPLSRVWNATFDIGYSHNVRIQPLTQAQVIACTSSTQNPQSACPANDATSYNDGFVGGSLHRQLGRTFHFFISYQVDELAFDRSFCGPTGTSCNRITNRQVATFGLDWTPRPIRLD